MQKIYKTRNQNFKRMSFLFVFQIILGIIPAVLFLVYALSLEEKNIWLGIVFISVMLFSFAGYLIAGRRYNVLVSGYRGEKHLIKLAKRFRGEYAIFANLPVRYKRNSSEIDLLLVGVKGAIMIEVKNHSGVISGSANAEIWSHRKYYRKGKVVEIEMDNPIKQVKRQREILKSILRAEGLDIWVDNVLYFSGKVALKINSSNDNFIASSEHELLDFINSYESRRPLSIEERDKIVSILTGLIKPATESFKLKLK